MPQDALVMYDYDCELVPVDKVETYPFEGTIAVELSTEIGIRIYVSLHE